MLCFAPILNRWPLKLCPLLLCFAVHWLLLFFFSLLAAQCRDFFWVQTDSVFKTESVLYFGWFPSSGLGTLILQAPAWPLFGKLELQKTHSQAGALAVIHKSWKARKAVISAGMPKSRPWMVTSRLCKCLIQVKCHTVTPCSRLQGHLSWPRFCHPWTLDFGIPAETTGLKHLCITLRAGAWERAQPQPATSGLRLRAMRIAAGLATSLTAFSSLKYT